MNTKGIIIGAIAAIIAIGIIASYSSTPSETVNLDMGRTHGDVSTAMGSPILGDPAAPITIVEFGDYQCSSCYTWFHKEKPAIYENYIATGKANLVFVDLAVLGRDSPIAAQASYCAEDQGMYWEYHDSLYSTLLAYLPESRQLSNKSISRPKLKAKAFNLSEFAQPLSIWDS